MRVGEFKTLKAYNLRYRHAVLAIRRLCQPEYYDQRILYCSINLMDMVDEIIICSYAVPDTIECACTGIQIGSKIHMF